MNLMHWIILYCALVVQTLAMQRDLIINGTITVESRYPYQVFYQDNDFPFCGGSLIAADVVLTAAHCLADAGGANITVMEGEYNLTDDAFGHVRTIRENVLHPLYKNETDNDFDIALTFLDRPTSIAEESLIRVNRDDSYPPDDTIATYLGWGVVNSKGEASNILRQVDVSVMSNEECSKINGTVYNNIQFSLSGQITPSMLCTFSDEGKDSCQRDSGGPLIVRGQDVSHDIQIGVSSWGVSCADPIFPGVASRVSYSWDFIQENVCSKSSRPPDYFECSTNNGEQSFQPQTVAPSSKSTNHTSNTKASIENNILAALGISLLYQLTTLLF